MSKQSFVLVLSVSLLTDNALAGTMGPIPQRPDWTWVSTFSGGAVWQSGGAKQTFNLTPDIQKTYAANQSTDALFDGEVFVGLQKRLSQALEGQLGFAVEVTSNARLAGFIWDDADPELANYTYSYKLQHTHVAAKGKLLSDVGYWLTPWISASLGVGFNNAYSFNNAPLIFEALPNTNFSSHTAMTFTYTLGVGVQKAFRSHWQVGAGYEFADWVQSQLHRSVGQTMGSGLRLSHLYTNGLLLNLTYTA